MSGASGALTAAAAASLAAAPRMGALAKSGGVSPEDASPGIGAFITFIVLAAVIILLAWSFTRHQRKIRARAAQEEAAVAQEAQRAADAAPDEDDDGENGAGVRPDGSEPDVADGTGSDGAEQDVSDEQDDRGRSGAGGA